MLSRNPRLWQRQLHREFLFLPTVGSKFQTGLSAAVGGEDRWCLSSGSVSDKVGHVAGRLDARMVPVEQFLLSSKVHPVMLAWLRLMFALTSQFFLSDIEEDVEVPLSVLNGQPVRRTEVCFDDENIGPQMTEGKHAVGPTGYRWDGQCILNVQIVQVDGHPALGPWDSLEDEQ